jgi:hypothetical protein
MVKNIFDTKRSREIWASLPQSFKDEGGRVVLIERWWSDGCDVSSSKTNCNSAWVLEFYILESDGSAMEFNSLPVALGPSSESHDIAIQKLS